MNERRTQVHRPMRLISCAPPSKIQLFSITTGCCFRAPSTWLQLCNWLQQFRAAVNHFNRATWTFLFLSERKKLFKQTRGVNWGLWSCARTAECGMKSAESKATIEKTKNFQVRRFFRLKWPWRALATDWVRSGSDWSRKIRRSPGRATSFSPFLVLPYRPVALIDLGADRKLSICSSKQRSVGSASEKILLARGFGALKSSLIC